MDWKIEKSSATTYDGLKVTRYYVIDPQGNLAKYETAYGHPAIRKFGTHSGAEKYIRKAKNPGV